MSFFEITKKIATSLERIFSSPKSQRKPETLKIRRLLIDPLEERQLLSVNTVTPNEQTVAAPDYFTNMNSTPTMSSNVFMIAGNDSYGGVTYIETEWSTDYMASNNQGDAIITWAQDDFVYQMNEDGTYQLDPATGLPIRKIDRFGNFYSDYNIYAQYLTDEVQRVTIPQELLNDNIAKSGSFKLVYAPHEVQKLSIKTVTASNYNSLGTGANVVGQFQIGGVNDINGDGMMEWTTVTFNENLSPAYNAEILRRAISALGGEYANVTVTADSSKDFLITFGDDCLGKNMPEFQIRNIQFTSGNYASAIMSTVSEPIVLTSLNSYGVDNGGILVDPSNPEVTAARIKKAFDDLSEMSLFPRVENYTRDIHMNPDGSIVDSYDMPSYQLFYTPDVKVTVIDANTFDITFVNGSGLMDHQQLVLLSATDEFGTQYITSATQSAAPSETKDVGVQTVKQSSDVFRVNSPERNDPDSSTPLVTNQLNPSVAMDADGDFVITWQSESSGTGGATYTDIYARRFSPQGFIQDIENDATITFYNDGFTATRTNGYQTNSKVQGVRPLGDQFKVNTFSNNFLTTPDVGMDYDGNFIITWSADYQYMQDFSGIYARRYDRYGNVMGEEILVSDPNVLYPQVQSHVSISNDGFVVITWVSSDSENIQNVTFNHGMFMSVYAQGSWTPITQQMQVSNGFNGRVDFDAHNNFVLTYTNSWSDGYTGTYGTQMVDSCAQLFSITGTAGNYVLTQTREEFVVHSLTNYLGDTYDQEYWLGQQYNVVGGLDSDGDLVFAYQGYGPDASGNNTTGSYGTSFGIDIPGSYFLPYLNDNKNSDLLKYFNPYNEYFYGSGSNYYSYDDLYYINDNTTDVDLAIRGYLAAAIRNGATDEQVARLNAVFESVVGMMRGGSNDIFTTRIDKGNWQTSSTSQPVQAQSSDANITSTRDGVNTRYYILVPDFSEIGTGNWHISGGTLNLEISTEYSTASVTVGVDIGMVNNAWNPSRLQQNIFNALNSCNDQLAYADNGFDDLLGPIFWSNWLYIPSAEVNLYAPGDYADLYGGTQWDLVYDTTNYYVYEITFVGGAHDKWVSMWFNNGTTLSLAANENTTPAAPTGNQSGYLRGPVIEQYGYEGSEQTSPGISVLPNGSYVASWFTNVTSTNGMIVDRKINYRYFQESTDSTGPHVTDVILPNGEYVPNNGQVAYNLDSLVVTFDKELLANSSTGAHSVTNPNNWALMKDGVELKGVIQEIQFGMNIARDLISDDSELAGGILSHGSNKWEAVITFSEPLGSGSYELVAKSNITDTTGVSFNNMTGKYVYGNGNPIGRDGALPNGENFTRLFNIVATDGLLTFNTGNGTGSYDDLLVSDIQGEHYTRTAEADDETAGNPTSVASDEQGNFVTVWTAEGNGIWAKIYRQEFIETANGRESVVTVYREFQVTNNPTATYASVAMDADGDFVVTWVQNSTNGKDIYAKAYNANGTSRTDADGNTISEFKVNSRETGVHNFPDIAMDSTGSFVITWESLNQVSKNSGYDIYYQRYDSACNALGGTAEVQAIQFVGNPTVGSTFNIEYEGRVTAAIPVGRNTTITATSIQAALNALGLDVEVQAYSSSTILVQFGGAKEKNVSQLNVIYYPSKSTQAITASTLSDGASGESRANNTTTGDQRYPSIDMAQDGSFIITWTSWGQGNDRPYESNIYAKNFPSNLSLIASQNSRTLSQRIQAMQANEQLGLKIVSADAIDNHLTGDENYTGVVRITAGDDTGLWMGSGSLLVSGSHILTAAHVVTTEIGEPVPVENISVTFVLPSGNVTYRVSQNSVHPDYAGDPSTQTDLAILTLETIAPSEAERYDLYRGNEEIGSMFTVVGFGTTGTGTTGNTGPAGTRHEGENKYEALGTIFSPEYSENTLVYDFDDGTSGHDALGVYFNIRDTGLGAAHEVTSAQGDSGGPNFISGKIAGVVSYGGPMFQNSTTDIDNQTNCSFGEFSVDVRVSAYADWIDEIVATGSAEYLVNETETGNQIWSDVAISMTGEVVFTWTSFAQDSAGDGPGGTVNGLAGVYARRFNLDGTPVAGSIGGVIVIPTEPSDPENPGEGEDDDPQPTIVGGVSLGGEFLVNDVITDNQWYSSVSIANNGDFIIVWESKQDANQIQKTLPDTGYGVGGVTTETIIDYGVYGKRYTSLATLMLSRDNDSQVKYGIPDETRYVSGYGYVGLHGEFGREFRINKDHVFGDQTGATVVLNANGDAIVVFQSEDDDTGKHDVYYRVIPRASDTAGPIVTETILVVDTPIDENGQPIRDTEIELQYDSNGSLVTQENDLVGIQDGSVIYGLPSQMIITFSEEMYNAYIQSPESILNPANWQLQRNGTTIYGIISKIDFGRDIAFDLGLVVTKTGKWEAILTFDIDYQTLGNQPLTSGTYKLTIKENATDNDLNKLDGDYSGLSGGNFTREFTVIAPAVSNQKPPINEEERPENIPDEPDQLAFNSLELGNDKPAIASAEDGSFIVVGVHYGIMSEDSVTEPLVPNVPVIVDEESGLALTKVGNIVLQRFDKNGNKIGTTKVVNNYMIGNQSSPDIAMDNFGNTAIVWQGAGSTSNSGIYLRLYDAYGEPIIDQLMVNTSITAQCSTPKVAYDENGNVFVTWLEYNLTTKSTVMKARVFTSDGVLQKTSLDSQLNATPGQLTRTKGTEEFVIVSENGRNVEAYDIAADANGNLAITWQMHNPATNSNSDDIYAKVLRYADNALTTGVGTFLVNIYKTGKQFNPTVATSDSGTFVVTWTSDKQDDKDPAKGYGQFGVFARRFNTANGAALPILGTTADALINTRTVYSQEYPDVSMSSNGNFVITWTSFDQELNNFDSVNRLPAHDKAVFARAFSNTGAELVEQYVPLESSESGYEWKEFRLNNTTLGNQRFSVATIDNDGVSFAWVGAVDSLLAYGEVDEETGAQTYLVYNTSGIFTRTYRVGAANSEQSVGGTTTANTLSRNLTIGSGYIGQSPAIYKKESLDAAFLEGTSGNDVFEVTVTQSGAVQVKINGIEKTVAASLKDLQIDGLGGNDQMIFTTAKGNTTVVLNAGEHRVSVNTDGGSLTFSALNIESAEFNIGGTNNFVNIFAAGNDTLELNSGSFKLTGDSFNSIGQGFSNITATGKTNSQLLMYDSLGNDSLTLSAGKAVMKGKDYSNTASGFNRITAYSSFGNDKAVLNGTAGNDSLYASPYGVSLVTGSSRNSVIGYSNVLVEGCGGVDSAAFVGSKYSDQFTGTSLYAEVLYGTGGKVGVYNYGNFTYNGQGGRDVVLLTDVNYKSSGGNRWEYDGKSQSYAIENVGDIRVIVEVSRVTPSQPQQAAALAADGNEDLYQLLAADNLNSSKSENANVENNEWDIDYLLKTGALDI
jgi:hypothetical protein